MGMATRKNSKSPEFLQGLYSLMSRTIKKEDDDSFLLCGYMDYLHSIFHPKTYIFWDEDENITAVTGSMNFSEHALNYNIEMIKILKSTSKDKNEIYVLH